MLDIAGRGSVRDERGRFVPGQSGNPAGKMPGTRNRATLLRAALDSEDGPAMARIVIDKALAGDVVTARFCLDRLEPRPRGRAIAIDLPEGARARDVVAAFDATVQAMAAGEITPDEAVQVTQVLDGRRKAIEAAWREEERDGRRTTVRPSPSGRGLGEGVDAASAGAGIVSSKHPHPAPPEQLSKGPQGEGTRLDERVRSGGSARTAGRGRGEIRANLLHSTCISRPYPVAGLPMPWFRGDGDTASETAR